MADAPKSPPKKKGKLPPWVLYGGGAAALALAYILYKRKTTAATTATGTTTSGGATGPAGMTGLTGATGARGAAGAPGTPGGDALAAQADARAKAAVTAAQAANTTSKDALAQYANLAKTVSLSRTIEHDLTDTTTTQEGQIQGLVKGEQYHQKEIEALQDAIGQAHSKKAAPKPAASNPAGASAQDATTTMSTGKTPVEQPESTAARDTNVVAPPHATNVEPQVPHTSSKLTVPEPVGGK